MNFYSKIKWILGILMIFVLIIATNLIDRNNFVRVRDSVVTIYEDRLIANDLIFEISNIVQKKEIALVKSDSVFFKNENSVINTQLQSLIERYEQTRLTNEEKKVFDDLKQNIKNLKTSESEFMNSNFEIKNGLSSTLSNLNEDLHKLSKIQLNEGSRQMSISKKAIDTVELFTQIEIYILVFLAILIQIIVMYQPKEKA